MEQESFKFNYYAFISYSHKDKDIAQRLQKFLQSYHLPSELQNSHPDLPENLNPIFIDESLVATGSLDESLQKNLCASNYLIVICSPNSAASKYVNDEVKYFIELGRRNHIVPLIIDGIPHSEDPSTECFTPAILELRDKEEYELLGIDMQRFGEEDSFLRVIATMLELNLDHFISWEEREREKRELEIKRKKKKKLMLLSSIAAVLTVIAGILIWHNIPHYRYYHTYAYKWAKPVGLFEVKSESDRMKMEYTYRFTTLRGKVTMIERVNSAGILVDPTIVSTLQEPPMICFVSDRTVEYYDLDRHKVYRKEYTKNLQAVDFYCAGEGDVPYALPSDTFDLYTSDKYNPEYSNNQTSGSIRRMTLEYDENGYVVKKLFRRDNTGGRDERGTPTQDIKGRWGFMHKYDGMGRAIETQALDKNGEPTSIDGVYFERTDYGNTPYSIKTGCYDENGSPALDIRGISFTLCDYDEYFNVLSWSCYGVNGERVLSRESNLAKGVFTYDPEKGFVTSASYYDTELAPCLHKDGNFRVEVKHNSEGRITGGYYYGVDGRRTTISGGYSGVRTEYNSEGQRSKVMFLDTEDNPAVNTDENVYGYKYSYENGFTKRIDKIDANGNLMLNKYGYASMTVDYDTVKNKVSGLTYTDTEGKRVLTSLGYAEERYTYYQGNKDSESYYDEDGKPAADSSGVAKYTYDWKDGNRISEKCFDKTGRLTANAQGYASAEYEYDENGLKIWERYYDADGKRTITCRKSNDDYGREITRVYSAVKYTYDNKGNQASTTYYDTEDNYMVQTGEYYCYAKEYDYYDNGKLKSRHYIKDMNSIYSDMLKGQVEYICYGYDSHGNETKRYCLNGRGEEVDHRCNPNGDVRLEKEYDIYGRQKKALFYRRGEENASTVQEYEYDSFGRQIALYGVRYRGNDRDVIVRKIERDRYGRVCKTYYLDGANKLFIPDKKYDNGLDCAIEKCSYDIFGNKTDIWYYDENEEQLHRLSVMVRLQQAFLKNTDPHDKAFHTVRTHDAKGNIITESYFNDEGEDEPIELSGGFHKLVRKYDASGHETERQLYGLNGELKQRVVKTYNTFGKITSTETYGADGKSSVDADKGVFRIVYAYDRYGNVSDTWYFDRDGKPCRRTDSSGKLREHHNKCSYDAMGKKLSEEVFDTEENPDSSYGGLYRLVFVYNSYGLRSEEIYYNINPELSMKKLIQYDSNGKKTKQEWVKTDSSQQ